LRLVTVELRSENEWHDVERRCAARSEGEAGGALGRRTRRCEDGAAAGGEHAAEERGGGGGGPVREDGVCLKVVRVPIKQRLQRGRPRERRRAFGGSGRHCAAMGVLETKLVCG